VTIINDPIQSKLGDRQQLSYIAAQAADARLNVELETEGMTLNIGPQHPATHELCESLRDLMASRSCGLNLPLDTCTVGTKS